MELSAPRGFRWDIWVPCVTAVLILAAVVVCLVMQRTDLPRLPDGVTVVRVRNAETDEVVADEGLEGVTDAVRSAGMGERQALSDKLPSLSLVFSDGSVWKVSFTVRGDTVLVRTEDGKARWLYSQPLARALSSLYYTSTLPEPTPSPAPSPSP